MPVYVSELCGMARHAVNELHIANQLRALQIQMLAKIANLNDDETKKMIGILSTLV